MHAAQARWTYGPEALTPCEADERRFRSVKFELLRCPQCGGGRVLQTETGSYQRCSSCACRTEAEHMWTSRSATEYSEGTREHRSHCAHCGRTRRWESIIPRVRKTETSSGGGGGFGGGSSSGGGGAGSSWMGNEQDEDWRDTPPSMHLRRAVKSGRAALGWDES